MHVQANEQLQARLEGLRSQPSALALAQSKQEEHIRDRDKFKTLIDNLQVLPDRTSITLSLCIMPAFGEDLVADGQLVDLFCRGVT